MQELREAFDADDVAKKNIALRRASDRIADLERALSALYRECLEAGLGDARDFLWPRVMDSARRALSPEDVSK
jgi:hypothetical protein